MFHVKLFIPRNYAEVFHVKHFLVGNLLPKFTIIYYYNTDKRPLQLRRYQIIGKKPAKQKNAGPKPCILSNFYLLCWVGVYLPRQKREKTRSMMSSAAA